MHPIALLSVVDHFERAVGGKKNKRVIGALLGENVNGVFELTNAYALPFDENPKVAGVWFVDHVYHEEMYQMFRKVNIKEKFLGWYVTGNSYQNNDTQIHELFAKYCANPVMIVVNVDDKESYELPTKAFCS
jgi:26S proteasome regulatory subunit N8